ncbi:MAG: PIN domain-containing protein [Coleofasciculus sp. C1-SOL-03]|jgi:hypothetical protein|uniref:PIN domain-containing protein n=1 Tax=Coleofasciculus sp. C1-SOL-03 TaxID=3069522 RepID=UPI0032FC3680
MRVKVTEQGLVIPQELLEGIQEVEIRRVDRPTVEQALSSNLKDFEDGIQWACAVLNQLDAIVTRDISDFSEVSLPVLSITQLQAQLSEAESGMIGNE